MSTATESPAARIAAAGIARPINWDELGSSSKDAWEERMIRSIERTARRTAPARRIPALGDRVIVDVVIFGEMYPVEVIVVQVDTHPGTLQPRIIGRPEGTKATAYARLDWREVPA